MLTNIVPVYGIREEYLRRCLDSLLVRKEGFKEEGLSVILIDDGSADQCGELCDQYAQMDGRLTVVHQKNAGVSTARNRGLLLAETEWISFVDADDWVEADYAKILCEELSGRFLEADVLLLDYIREQKGGGKKLTLDISEGEIRGGLLEEIRKSTYYKLQIRGNNSPYDMVVLWNKVYRRQFLEEHGVRFIPEARKGQDRLFNADVFLSVTRVYYLHRALYHYRCLEESRTNRYDPKVLDLTRIELRALQKILEKHQMLDHVKKYLDYRISTRLYACLRLYCFHPSNTSSLREKMRQAAELASSQPFADAVRKVDLRLLNRQERIFVKCIRKKQFGLVYLLVRLKSSATGRGLR